MSGSEHLLAAPCIALVLYISLEKMSSSLVSAMRRASGLVGKAGKQQQARKARDLHTSRAALGSLQIPDRLQHVVDAQV